MVNIKNLTTESAPPPDQYLDRLTLTEKFRQINEADKTVAFAVEKALPQIENLTAVIIEKMKQGGRLFYIGAGTSGRIGVLDASEIPPTFGIDFEKVIGLIAGGDGAIRKAVEGAEDNIEQAWIDISYWDPNKNDVVIGLAASGRTPYAIGGLKSAREHGLVTGCIVCNRNSEMAEHSDYPVEIIVGSEALPGSSRMKAGTAQKMALNMISTVTMAELGYVRCGRMVNMNPSNEKLVERAIDMIIQITDEEKLYPPVNRNQAEKLLEHFGRVKPVLEALDKTGGNVQAALELMEPA